jgi:hypothetical protein
MQKSLENKPIGKGLSYGVIFFPGEAKSANQCRLQLKETDTGEVHVLTMNLYPGNKGRIRLGSRKRTRGGIS